MEGFEPSSSAHVTHYPLLLLHLLTHCTSFTTPPPLFSFDLAIIGIFCTELCLVPFPKDHRPRPTLFTFILRLWSFSFFFFLKNKGTILRTRKCTPEETFHGQSKEEKLLRPLCDICWNTLVTRSEELPLFRHQVVRQKKALR